MGCAGVKKPYNKHDTYVHTCVLTHVYVCKLMISHFGFMVGGGDGDGDSGVVSASIYM